jgi:hypothetical protein
MKQSSLLNYLTSSQCENKRTDSLSARQVSFDGGLMNSFPTSSSSSTHSVLHGEPLLSSTLATSSSINSQQHLGNSSPHQPTNINFPKSKFGDRERSFSAAWYCGRPWLEYSEKKMQPSVTAVDYLVHLVQQWKPHSQ